VIENNWSRSVLLNWLDTSLYERQGKAISNFDIHLSLPQGDLAQEITKDPYNFDLLFYNARLHCYVVVEVKTDKFNSAYIGQLGTYVVAANHILKTDKDNPTIGLLICKEKDNVLAQYALESSSEPIGISEYELSKLYPADFKGSLPSIEEIEQQFK